MEGMMGTRRRKMAKENKRKKDTTMGIALVADGASVPVPVPVREGVTA